jgi:cell division protein ZapB
MRNDLMELEQQVEKLIQLVERLDQENRHLRKQQGDLKRNRALLLKQRDEARAQIDAILSRLKNYEVLS